MSATPTQEPTTILICDDEAHIVYILQAKLEQAGYDVIVERNGRDAYEAACVNRVDLAITDFNMPIMDGLEFALELRSNPATAAVPVLMLTARGHAVADEDRARTNIVAMESKPFSARDLLRRVQEILGAAAGEAASAQAA